MKPKPSGAASIFYPTQKEQKYTEAVLQQLGSYIFIAVDCENEAQRCNCGYKIYIF